MRGVICSHPPLSHRKMALTVHWNGVSGGGCFFLTFLGRTRLYGWRKCQDFTKDCQKIPHFFVNFHWHPGFQVEILKPEFRPHISVCIWMLCSWYSLHVSCNIIDHKAHRCHEYFTVSCSAWVCCWGGGLIYSLVCDFINIIHKSHFSARLETAKTL